MESDPDVDRFLDLLTKVGNGRSAMRAAEMLRDEITVPITITWNIRIQPQANGELKVTDTIKFAERAESIFTCDGKQLELLPRASQG